MDACGQVSQGWTEEDLRLESGEMEVESGPWALEGHWKDEDWGLIRRKWGDECGFSCRTAKHPLLAERLRRRIWVLCKVVYCGNSLGLSSRIRRIARISLSGTSTGVGTSGILSPREKTITSAP